MKTLALLSLITMFLFGCKTQTVKLPEDCGGPYQESCSTLAYHYEDGLNGLPVDIQKAIKFREKACQQGSMFNCTRLGKYHQNGEYVTQNYLKAKEFYEKSCYTKVKDEEGCAQLGMLYKYGMGVESDLAKAFSLLDESCTGYERYQKNIVRSFVACSLLAQMYQYGEFVDKNINQAISLYELGCKWDIYLQGWPCSQLGDIYLAGVQVPQDKEQAIAYYKKACNLGNKESCDEEWKIRFKQNI